MGEKMGDERSELPLMTMLTSRSCRQSMNTSVLALLLAVALLLPGLHICSVAHQEEVLGHRPSETNIARQSLSIEVKALDVYSPALLQQPPAAAEPGRQHIVREVRTQYWHLLDGDQLLVDDGGSPKPPRGGDARDAAWTEIRKDERPKTRLEEVEDFSAVKDSIKLAAAVVTHGMRRLGHHSSSGSAAAARRQHSDAPSPMELVDDGPETHDADAVSAGDDDEVSSSPRLHLRDLRIIIRLADREERDDGGRPRELGQHIGLSARRGLRSRVRDSSPALGEIKERRSLSTPLETGAVEQSTTAVKTLDSTSAVDPRRRCVVASGRGAAEVAAVAAFMDGRLHPGCLIVAADVGNDIPGNSNSVGGAAAAFTLSVFMLCTVFLFLF